MHHSRSTRRRGSGSLVAARRARTRALRREQVSRCAWRETHNSPDPRLSTVFARGWFVRWHDDPRERLRRDLAPGAIGARLSIRSETTGSASSSLARWPKTCVAGGFRIGRMQWSVLLDGLRFVQRLVQGCTPSRWKVPPPVLSTGTGWSRSEGSVLPSATFGAALWSVRCLATPCHAA